MCHSYIWKHQILSRWIPALHGRLLKLALTQHSVTHLSHSDCILHLFNSYEKDIYNATSGLCRGVIAAITPQYSDQRGFQMAGCES